MLIAEGGVPERVKVSYLTDADIIALADYAAWLHARGLAAAAAVSARPDVPTLLAELEVGVRDDRLQPFLEAVYKLHIAAIRPQGERRVAGAGATEEAAESVAAIVPTLTRIVNVHDFVAEMVVGTWLAFDHDGKTINARLSWVSPMRTKYIFTTRSRGHALAVSPEELAWQLRDGTARATQVIGELRGLLLARRLYRRGRQFGMFTSGPG